MTTTMETIAIERRGGIATVTLTGKTMPPAFFRDCEAAFGELSADDELRAVIVRGGYDKAFTYGLDLPAAFAAHGTLFQGGGARDRRKLLELIRELQGAFNAIEACPVPVIAAVHGRCIGGGVDLIAACDIRLATQDATFSVRETKIAIVADLGSLQRLPRIVGHGVARELAFTGKDIDAARAERVGLINGISIDRARLDADARAMAEEIAANAPLTVRGVKDVMRYSADRSVADGLEYVAAWNSAFLASEDLGEAVQAFMGKRPPSFKGR